MDLAREATPPGLRCRVQVVVDSFPKFAHATTHIQTHYAYEIVNVEMFLYFFVILISKFLSMR